jgi:signal transduction histidine kinase
MRQLEFMSDTIENFSSFYKPDTQKEFFSLKEQTLFALDIVRSELNSHNIKAEFAVIQDSDVLGYKNQYVQVVLNLLVNARDALLDMDKDDKKINIRIDKNLVKVQDNGGGIKEDIMAKIFDPHFSTKPKNSGIGLYMSKVIIENNMNGSLDVKNYEFGVIFTIAL